MTAPMRHCHRSPIATDGEIAAINLESARRRAWARFAQDPGAPGVAEALLDHERVAAQFFGDVDALDRLEALASQLTSVDGSFRAALVEAEVSSTTHRFDEARRHLARATLIGAPPEEIARQSLAIDQACGMNLAAVLPDRRRMAASGRIEDLVPLGALLADLGWFAEADDIYGQALRTYDNISPFPLAWVCFQLGILWGELTPAPQPAIAADWYRRAIAYVPGYVKARVHLAEILASLGETRNAEALLRPALTSRDPEVRWRLADVLVAQARFDEAHTELDAARSAFEELLSKHRLAFADHAAEFYAGSGGDSSRAVELARANAANRPTRRAIEQAIAMARIAEHGRKGPACQ